MWMINIKIKEEIAEDATASEDVTEMLILRRHFY